MWAKITLLLNVILKFDIMRIIYVIMFLFAALIIGYQYLNKTFLYSLG